jgi:hypothetical protein
MIAMTTSSSMRVNLDCDFIPGPLTIRAGASKTSECQLTHAADSAAGPTFDPPPHSPSQEQTHPRAHTSPENRNGLASIAGSHEEYLTPSPSSSDGHARQRTAGLQVSPVCYDANVMHALMAPLEPTVNQGVCAFLG